MMLRMMMMMLMMMKLVELNYTETLQPAFKVDVGRLSGTNSCSLVPLILVPLSASALE